MVAFFLAITDFSSLSAESNTRVEDAVATILKLCIAGGSESVTITKKVDKIALEGSGSYVEIDRKELSGLVGGISKEITALSAQQASEARSCTQKYLKELVDIILKDTPTPDFRVLNEHSIDSKITWSSDPESFWGGKGVWQNQKNYCAELLRFLSDSEDLENFKYPYI